ncbi:MAG: helix-turn-helix transcriptional regulator [Propionibacteriales bacterium]|nr:helix-turn-helix transcriptional regulator [Propionibacteriales bacterium]
MSIVDELHRAREAYERREWVAAYRALSDLGDAELMPDDFMALATTAYLLGHRNDCVQALQRAYQTYLDQGDTLGAVRAACSLTIALWMGGEVAVGGGWQARAEHLLDEVPDDAVERGYLYDVNLIGHVIKGKFAEAFATAPKITEYGRRYGDPDLLALGVHSEGRLMVYSGQVAEGLQRLDEAMVGVMAGEVSPIAAGRVYCSTVETCQEVSDLGRASEWTHALATWCDDQPGLVAFTGQCAVHRGQLMRFHGAYVDALEELARAAERYTLAGGDPAIGLAHAERGDVLRLMGEYAAAQEAYDEAVRFGNQAQPGRALLWSAEGRTEPAAAAIRRALGEAGDPVHRSQLLPGAVEVLLAAGADDEAAALAEELAVISESFGCAALRAATSGAAARVALVRADADAALVAARLAIGEWASLSVTYEVSRCRVLVGRALRLIGDEESATAEVTEARKVFVELGAASAAREAAALLGPAERPGGLSPREVEVLRLVAAGKSNPQIAATLVLSDKTVARHLSNIFTKLDVGSRTAAAAFAYEHRLV